MQKFSYLKSINADYLDEYFQKYLKDPESVDPTWRYFFEGLELGAIQSRIDPLPAAQKSDKKADAPNGHAQPTADFAAEGKVAELIRAYREYGCLVAQTDPLHAPPSSHPWLEPSSHGLGDADLHKTFQAARLLGLGPSTLSDIITRLRQIYCSTIGVEYVQVKDSTEREWLRMRLESPHAREALLPDARRKILDRLLLSESFERFLHTRYVAQKRFSIEGAESMIPALDCMIETAADAGTAEVVIGMAHRGRLNVLTNLMGKKAEYIFAEFEGNYKFDISHGEGDVKYHQGYSTDMETASGKAVHLSLAANPSHLEFADPVIEGIARAKQEMLKDETGVRVLPIMIHGDAAFSGQGVVYETLNFAALPGYKTGGTLHLVINNQIGFTANPEDTRSTTFCTDLAKMLDAPIFHVNGDDVEALVWVSKICTEYRARFGKDSFIDLICYRKYGHNEGDEPSFTQPLLYKLIKTHPSPGEIYGSQLVAEGVVKAEEIQARNDELMAKYTQAQAVAKAEAPHPEPSAFHGNWTGFKHASHEDLFKPVETALPEKSLLELSEKINTIPAGFHLHPKLTRFFEARAKAIAGGAGIDWGNGEALAYASLLAEGYSVRISGQDAQRGTFTHRHSVLKDFETGEDYTPLNHISTDQAPFAAYCSHLSETGVMGFEYGYALANPKALVIWEAQFGDFANGAQVIIDQFLAAGESKWLRSNGLVLLLPHGYEGQAAEHSSARIERFLTLAGRDNFFVCNFTTPAQLFHAMRRHMKRDFRKPMIIMSPKSLLRLPQAVSTLREFSEGSFQEVLDDPGLGDTSEAVATTVLLCSGKVYYELVAEREAKKAWNIGIVRLEQLYPFPEAKLTEVLKRYTQAQDIAWVQEEPRNMGAWSYIFNQWSGGIGEFSKQIGGRGIRYVGRDIAASPAVGSAKYHEVEQRALIEKAFEPLKGGRA